MSNGEEILASCRGLTNSRLLQELRALAAAERIEIVKILARLSVLGERELEKEVGFSSVYLFCVRDLGFCEGTAYYRSKAARACGRFPRLLEMVQAGDLGVTAAALLADPLTPENFETLIGRAKGASRRDLEKILAGLDPQAKPPERARVIAVLEAPKVVPADSPRDQRELVLTSQPRVELRIEHTFSFDEAAEQKLSRARNLLSHRYPMGDLESIFDPALDVLLQTLEDHPPELSKPRVPRPRDRQTRRIPKWVERIVRARDGNRCAYVSPDGVRCEELRLLELDHIVPWAMGGSSDDPKNIRLTCSSHNQRRARRGAGFEEEGST